MTVEPSDFRHDQWVRYNNHLVNSIILIALGWTLMLIGFSWGAHGISPAIQETTNGVIINGEIQKGAFFGPAIAANGILIFSLAPPQIRKAKRIKRWVQ